MGEKAVPDYYAMGESRDVFAWLATLPVPQLPADRLLSAWALYATGFRYVRRCLWKGQTPAAMASDARKAIACLERLAEVLEGEVQGGEPDGASLLCGLAVRADATLCQCCAVEHQTPVE